MMTPEISIVLPVHNGEPYIAATLDSILSQTHREFRLIILENASQDRTLDIVRGYRDARIQIVASESLLSITENWQRILSLDLDDYVTIIGHDDRLLPDFLSEMIALIERNPDDSLYHAHFHLIDNEGQPQRACLPMPERETGEAFLQARHRLRRDSYGTGYVMRSADYKAVGGLPPFPSLIYADDLTWYRLASLRGKVCSPKFLFDYRVHASSAASMVGLPDLYQASKHYLSALVDSDYFKSAENVALAKNYVAYMFNGYCHRQLVDLIYNGTPQKLSAFRNVKAQFMAEAESDQLFTVYDSACKIYEALAAIPLRSLRTLLLQPIEVIRTYRQRQRTT